VVKVLVSVADEASYTGFLMHLITR